MPDYNIQTVFDVLNNLQKDVNKIKESGITGTLSGDVTGKTTASVVANVGGKTATEVAAAVTDVSNATSNNTPNTIVRRGADGSIAVGGLTCNSNLTVKGDTTLGDNSNDSISILGKISSDINMNNYSISSLNNLTVNGSTQIGNNANDTLSFFGRSPVVQQSATDINTVIAALKEYGLLAQ